MTSEEYLAYYDTTVAFVIAKHLMLCYNRENKGTK